MKYANREPWTGYPELVFTPTVNFCERCKRQKKCLGLKWLSDEAWRKSEFFHTDVVDKILEEIEEVTELIEEAIPEEEEVPV